MARFAFGFVLLVAIAVVSSDRPYAPRYQEHIPILRDDRTQNAYGEYTFDFGAGNGISRQESGSQSYGQASQGGWKYTAPDGQVVDIVFSAGQGGYQPQGAVLPTPPPLPYVRTGHGF